MTLYGFFHCSCIYESADGLVSLHHTKAGAWRAKRHYLVARCEDERENALRYGFGMRDHPSEHERFTIAPVEVQP